jgi:uncharacterized protein YhaN
MRENTRVKRNTRRRKMMIKIIMSIGLILSIIVAVAAAFYVNDFLDTKVEDVRMTQARREDLIAQQGSIQLQIVNLNKSLLTEADRQDELNRKVTALTQEVAELAALANSTEITVVNVTVPVVKAVTPAPTPATKPKPVTRAS